MGLLCLLPERDIQRSQEMHAEVKKHGLMENDLLTTSSTLLTFMQNVAVLCKHCRCSTRLPLEMCCYQMHSFCWIHGAWAR